MRAEQGHEDYQPFTHGNFAWGSYEQQPPKDHFSGNLILLVDSGCLSACEDFVVPFKVNHRDSLSAKPPAAAPASLSNSISATE